MARDVGCDAEKAFREPRRSVWYRRGRGTPKGSGRGGGLAGGGVQLFNGKGERHITLRVFFRLVLVCIETNFCIQVRIFQHFSKSTRRSSSREQILQISAKKLENFAKFLTFFRKFCKILQNFQKSAKFWQNFAEFFTEFFAEFYRNA